MVKLLTSGLALLTASSLWASSLTGDYLAMQHAFDQLDDPVASSYIDRALEAMPESAPLYDQALIMAIYERDLDKTSKLAEIARGLDAGSQIPDLADLAVALNGEDYDKVRDLSQKFDFLDPAIIEAWALAGNGDADAGLARLEAAAEETAELAPLYDFERAMILASVEKDYSAAAEILMADGDPLLLTQTSYLDFWAIRILSGEDGIDEALIAQFGAREYWPRELSVIIDTAQAGNVHPSLGFVSAQNGIAEYIAFTIQQSEVARLPQGIARLMYLMMPVIAPSKDIYNVQLMAYFLERREYDDVISTAELIEDVSPYRLKRDIYRFYAHVSMDDLDAAKASLFEKPETIEELSFWADAQRQLEENETAYGAYLELLEFPDLTDGRRAGLEFLAGVTAQMIDQEDDAFAHLERALELDPENTEYLNHLGYSLVDTGRDVEAGLEMVEKAVDLSQGEAHILDSLGWAYFKVGRFDEAVQPMELSIASMAYHPVINAHLGDVYWKVGREREAVYNWKRALENLEEDLPDITRVELEDRLANGLE